MDNIQTDNISPVNPFTLTSVLFVICSCFFRFLCFLGSVCAEPLPRYLIPCWWWENPAKKIGLQRHAVKSGREESSLHRTQWEKAEKTGALSQPISAASITDTCSIVLKMNIWEHGEFTIYTHLIIGTRTITHTWSWVHPLIIFVENKYK